MQYINSRSNNSYTPFSVAKYEVIMEKTHSAIIKHMYCTYAWDTFNEQKRERNASANSCVLTSANKI